jgi:hypothetical protein
VGRTSRFRSRGERRSSSRNSATRRSL